ncbi:DEAD/DEAH box helicase [Colwellia sp. C1TZA3]|uniref:DEAD/DEAH box helicase n=1 Tax=Colwellia sp. C1TZA3 TaxID=2508879 RepID=UPI0011BA3863|nr:DEAD/DEAH box helicase [Colwellia sp. C1TZA3]TWX65766.1 DEAD/DEAH box helicase [Colwellia sp. C1TZA3]
MPFSQLGLSNPIVNAIADLNYRQPTDIQKQAIPVILSGKDVIAAAQTGTGKTASFVLPLLEKLSAADNDEACNLRGKRIRVLIVTPTRELAVQVEANIAQYSKYLNISSMAMYGGTEIEPQKQCLIWGIDILVATPGRLLDMAHQRAVYFDQLEAFVLDEADRMLDMGFIDDINKIIERLPEKRQNLLFSATISDDVRALAKRTLYHANEISIAKNSASKPKISQWLVTVDKTNKSALLSYLIKQQQWQQALIFIETKHGAAKLVSQLEKRGIKAESIHSGRTQAIREQILNDFKAGKIEFLVATAIAARGIDIGELARVVNYDLPDKVDDYTHRIGRTGRAGKNGEAVSFVAKDNFRNLCAIESDLGHVIERREFDEFPVKKVVPVSILNYVPKNKRS